MKKFFSLFGSNRSTSQTYNINVNAPAYTKEFTYLPSYHWVQSIEYTPPTTEEPFAKAKYLIKNTMDTMVYQNYENILKKDGWIITLGQKYINISAIKDTHIANISFSMLDKDVIMTVQSD